MATVYHVAEDGSGDFTTVAQVNSASKSPGDQFLFRKGDTWRERLTIVNQSGTSGNPITYGNYGSGELPLITGFDVVSNAWSQYLSTNIYSSTNTQTSNRMVTQDGTVLTYVAWTTNIATTSALMSAGTWTQDNTNHLLYVWTTDSVDPTSKTIEFSNRNNAVLFTSGSNYVIVDAIQCTGSINECISLGLGDNSLANNSNHSIVKNCVVYNTGQRGIGSFGSYNLISSNEVYSYNTHVNTSDNGGIVVYDDNNIVEYNYIHDSIWGSAIEVNSVASQSDRTYDNIIRFNRGINLTNQFIELWVAYSNQVYSNYGENIIKDAIKVTNMSHDNIIFNNIINGYGITGLSVYKINATSYVLNNKFYNNTVVSVGSPTSSALFVAESGNTGNIFKNNVAITSNHSAGSFQDSTTIADYNNYYTTGGTLTNWMGTSYSTAQFSTYQSVSGQDANSIISDPQLRTDYGLTAGSPAIGAGINVPEVITDFIGAPRGNLPDIGAWEWMQGLHFDGVILDGVVVS